MAGQGQQNKMIDLIEKGWVQVKEGAVDKIQDFLKDGDKEKLFSTKEYMKYYT